MPYLHLSGRQHPNGIRNSPFGDTEHTDCLSNFFCSLRRTTKRASSFCFFFSSCSSACSFSLACCFFSMSVRRFCAVDDELWDKVPSRAPNSLCPRLRSSICPLLRRSDCRVSWVADCWGDTVSGSLPLVSLWPSLGRFDRSSEKEDCLRFRVAGGEGDCSDSGRMTAEARAL